MSVRMRSNKSHTGNRRAHHRVSEARLSVCDKCGADHVRHQMCPKCGVYRGREVIDVKSAFEKKEAKRKAKKEMIRGGAPSEAEEEKPARLDGSSRSGGEAPKELNAEALSTTDGK